MYITNPNLYFSYLRSHRHSSDRRVCVGNPIASLPFGGKAFWVWTAMAMGALVAGFTLQPGSPKRLSHCIAASGRGIIPACGRLGGSETFIRSRWGDFGACFGRSRFRGFIEPHRQRDPSAFWVDLQHLDTDDIARLRNFARVLDISIGHCGDVHQPVLVNPDIDEGAKCGDVRHDAFEN